jgi:hypothetical protein
MALIVDHYVLTPLTRYDTIGSIVPAITRINFLFRPGRLKEYLGTAGAGSGNNLETYEGFVCLNRDNSGSF